MLDVKIHTRPEKTASDRLPPGHLPRLRRQRPPTGDHRASEYPGWKACGVTQYSGVLQVRRLPVREAVQFPVSPSELVAELAANWDPGQPADAFSLRKGMIYL